MYINSNGGGCGDETPKTINFCDKLSFTLSFFFWSASTAATYFEVICLI